MKFSVLIAVYDKELPSNLRQSLDSIFNQQMPPNEVVLVEDGPITQALEQVVMDYTIMYPELKVVKLEHNVGLGLALSEGLKHCSYDIVARMDSDDLSRPERFSKQAAWMELHPETDVIGSWVDEFSDDSSKIISTRRLPETHSELLRFSRYRNPMNHPTVMFRKKAVLEAGSYRHCPLFEDYDLWVRMMQHGAKFHNLQESLLLFRLTTQLFDRRGGRMYIRQELNFQRKMYHMGHITLSRLIVNCIVRTLLRLIPNGWRKFGYLFFLRR